jgi:hypothetical protein
MRSKTFAALLIALAAATFAATALANIAIDPQGVFATGLFGNPLNPNTRYRRFLAYQRAAHKVDGLLFASSRGGAFDSDLLAQRMGVRAVASFAVPFGLLSDHLPFLEYVVRDKARRGERIGAVLLIIDADHFGKAPWTNVNIDSFLPPPVSGEGAAYFWWRYLTAFQYQNWRKAIARRRSHAAERTADEEPALPPARAVRPSIPRPDFDNQLALLGRFARLCADNAIRLTVATSPLSRSNARALDADELAKVVERLAAVVPLWDFSAPAPLASRADLWLDASHFSPLLARMMVDRMFLSGSTGDFGRLLGTP